MIKITLLTLMSAGLIGTGAQTLSPQELELAAGNVSVMASSEGFETVMNTKPEYAIRISLKSGRSVALQF